jgi:hypothetical protein
MAFAKDDAMSNVTTITCTFTNKAPGPLSKLLFQVAVPKYLDEHLYNIQCSEIFTLRNENLHTEA